MNQDKVKGLVMRLQEISLDLEEIAEDLQSDKSLHHQMIGYCKVMVTKMTPSERVMLYDILCNVTYLDYLIGTLKVEISRDQTIVGWKA